MKRVAAALVLVAIFGWLAFAVGSDLVEAYREGGVAQVAYVVLFVAVVVGVWRWAERNVR